MTRYGANSRTVELFTTCLAEGQIKSVSDLAPDASPLTRSDEHYNLLDRDREAYVLLVYEHQ